MSTRYPLRRLVEFDSHHRVALALVVAVVAFALACQRLRAPVSLIIAWDAFTLCSLLLAWGGMFYTDAQTRVREAVLQDSSRTAICICVVLAAVAGLCGAAVLLGAARRMHENALPHVALAGLTVVASWFLVHTVLALHYTHVCYNDASEAGGRGQHGACLGVTFPDELKPDFLDFAYFSFVIGMTCQVSDVVITSRRVRRIALLHGMLSFGFNTVVLALTLNLASALL